MAFGLGAGACFYYLALEDASPTPLVQRPHGAAGGELPRADRGGAGAADLRARATTRPGRRPGPRSTPAARPCCSPTSTTSTTTATRPTSPATRWSSPATTSEVAQLSDTGFEELQTTPAGEPRQGAPQRPPRLPARRPHVHGRRRGRPRSSCEAAVPAAIERAAQEMVEPSLGEFAGLARRRAPRRRGRLLARGRRGLAVVRPLRLPGDRAPRHRRRRLPADVLALPRGGRARPRRRSPPRPRRAGPSWRAPSTRRARARSRSRPLARRRRRGPARRRGRERLWTSLAEPRRPVAASRPAAAASSAEPSGSAARPEMLLLGDEGGRGLLQGAGRPRGRKSTSTRPTCRRRTR